ncbi:uncharacterized protein BO88DRAFT_353851 [Aspergillus vadensis CBS 113365]|uniref:Uncharacterized protein n=1 Tax=Aspergillus vadensis (strain CBS 113365 / IMI 142717 / IBT 24658) TaxID=1448311 RepID=A0A319B9M2_ASPVC|nr:hypothetical protein BO88DRAFT_353851 [Aspergillus vadensis CBS 113365]PYH63203.1 hypothetical protein BO88DRAFT_353851 [Aspergillus vadensis CBS 113365]
MADGQARFRQAVRRKESIAKSETFDCGNCQTQADKPVMMYLASCLVLGSDSTKPGTREELTQFFASNRGTQKYLVSTKNEEDPDRSSQGEGMARSNDSRPRQGTGRKKGV